MEPHTHPEDDIIGLINDLNKKVNNNPEITGKFQTKIKFDFKGLVIEGADATTLDIIESGDKRYCSAKEKEALAGITSNQTNTSPISVTNTTDEIIILSRILPANFLKEGTQFRFEFEGTHQSKASSGTLNIRLSIGSNSSPAIQMPPRPSAIVQSPMIFRGKATVRSAGVGGIYIATGFYDIYSSPRINYGQGGPSIIAVDTTVENTVKVTAQWSIANVSNSLLIQNASIEVIKV